MKINNKIVINKKGYKGGCFLSKDIIKSLIQICVDNRNKIKERNSIMSS